MANTLFVTIAPTGKETRCPHCHTPSRRVHSVYVRQLRDLPLQGRHLELRVRARRFRCPNASCPRKTFTESLGELAGRYAQRTKRLTDVLRALILRVSSHTGAYLAERLGIPISPRTLLRLVDRREPVTGTLRVVGIDDFALRRGQVYGTLVCDLETGRPVDLLWGRTAEPVRQWLQRHPEIEGVVRDRASSYADAVQSTLPGAVQVADRFHRVRNAVEALKEVLDSQKWTLPPVPWASSEQPAAPAPPHPPATPPQPNRQQARKEATARRRRERYDEIHRRYRQGESARSSAQNMGLDRKTVRKYLLAREVPLYSAGPPQPRKMDRFLAYLQKRWDAGCRNGRRLYEELVPLGYDGSASTVRRALSQWRKQRGAEVAIGQVPPPSPRWRDLRWLVLCPRQRLTDENRSRLEALLEANPTLKLAYDLTQWFRRLLKERRVEDLGAWLEAATGSQLAPFRRLSRTLTEDLPAIRAAVQQPWSTGPVEGHIHRLKLLKRLGYGRASLALLRARVLAR